MKTRVFMVTSQGLEEDLSVKLFRLHPDMRIEVSDGMEVSFSSQNGILTVGQSAEVSV